ncbi:autophagy-related protein 17 [Auriculariales sp. MPI-PUGE-AT-0066]|nr:autophagy-related protein 17 [Auriculariales sp. MPI-PUGE-AT-0066]
MSHPELASLVEQSKDALRNGERLCIRANFLVQDSARIGVDVLALDARVRWLSDGVLEQLKLAAQVAKTLEEQRLRLAHEAREWDQLRSQHMIALDQVLDACGSQVVPTSFHAAPQHTSASTDSDGEGDIFRDPVELNGATSSTLKPVPRPPLTKTLRDFIDERAIEETADEVDDDRNRIDDLLATTARAQLQLEAEIASLEQPTDEALPNLEPLLEQQEHDAGEMARHLTSLATHLDQVNGAAEEQAGGHDIALEDLEILVRDTAVLPTIVSLLEDAVTRIDGVHGQFSSHHAAQSAALDSLARTVSRLAQLEAQLETALAEQVDVEVEVRSVLAELHDHLETLDGLRATYTSYRLAYGKLVLELARRERYGAAAQQVLESALATVDAMREDEERDRALFFAEQGSYLPDDLCLFVGNAPPRVSVGVGPREDLPPLPEELIVEARRNVDLWEGRL